MEDLRRTVTWQDKIYRPYQVAMLFHPGHVAVMIGATRRDVYRYMEKGHLKGQQTISRRWYFSLEEINRFRRGMLMPELTADEAWDFWENCEQL